MFIIPAPQSEFFRVFGVSVYWYGVIMAFAIFTAILTGNSLYNRFVGNSRKDLIIDYASLLILVGIACARLYFCILNHNYYFSHPLEIFDIRQGGLSVHGAISGGCLTLFFIAKKCKVSLLKLSDVMGCVTILGQSIGRWGNYFNSEAYGLPVSGQTWGLFIPETKRVFEYANYSLFHPTFLYESIADLFAFCILLSVFLKFGKKYPGLTFFSYLTIYAVIRFFIEMLRVDSALNIGSVPVAQAVSVVMFAVGIIGVLVVLKRSR